DPVLALPWSMPALFALASGGSALACALTPATRIALAILWASGLSSALAMLMAVSVTQRYTADFAPFLLTAAAFGLAAIARAPRHARRAATGALIFFTVAGIAVTFAITLHHQREIVWGVPPEHRDEYQRWRERIDLFTGTAVPALPSAPE